MAREVMFMIKIFAAEIAELALKNRLPDTTSFREYAEAGRLMTYGTNFEALYRRAAT